MQDVLVSLKNTLTTTTEALGNQIESLATLATNSYTKILTGSYVGNGQTNLRVPWPDKEGRDFDEVKVVIFYKVAGGGRSVFSIGAGTVINSSYTNYDYTSSIMAFQMWLDDPQYCFKVVFNNNDVEFGNDSGKTYNYILLG